MTFDLVSIERANGAAKARIEYVAARYESHQDKHRGHRLAAILCVWCWGDSRQIAGDRHQCGICSGACGADILCAKCADVNGLCRRCGADIDLKIRRKKYPFQEK